MEQTNIIQSDEQRLIFTHQDKNVQITKLFTQHLYRVTSKICENLMKYWNLTDSTDHLLQMSRGWSSTAVLQTFQPLTCAITTIETLTLTSVGYTRLIIL